MSDIMDIEDFTVVVYEEVVRNLVDEGYEASFRPDYSGRGMYGVTKNAIVTDCASLRVGALFVKAIVDMKETHNIEHMELIDYIQDIVPENQDSMGLSMVYY